VFDAPVMVSAFEALMRRELGGRSWELRGEG
jgi:hypothetical protein